MMIRKETLKGAQLSSAALTLKKQSPQNELYVQHLEAELKKLSAANSAEVRIKACRELSNLFYLGGVLETYLQDEPKALDIVLAIVQNHRESSLLRVSAFQTLSCLCLSTEPVKLILCKRHMVQIMIRLFRDEDAMIRKWAIHCTFLIALKHHRKYSMFLHGTHLTDMVKKIAAEDWSMFRYNDAERLIAVIEETECQ